MYPLRVRVQQKFVRPFLKNRLSTPFISRAFFRSLCDISLDPWPQKSRTWLQDLRQARVVFCKSSDLLFVLEELKKELSGKTLVAADADVDFFNHDLPLNSLKRLFLQNSFISDGKRIKTLPIGVENLSIAINGLPWNLKPTKKERAGGVLIGPMSITHPVRKQLLLNIDEFHEEGFKVIRKTITPTKYAKLSSRFIAVACPRGNGEDTHRLWESLYRESYPIVLRNLWSEGLESLKLPLLFVEDWSIKELTRVRKSLPNESFNAKSIPALWSDYWQKQIQS